LQSDPILFLKNGIVSDPNPVLVEIILSASENYPKVYHDAQHNFSVAFTAYYLMSRDVEAVEVVLFSWSGRGTAKILSLPLPHRLFDLESNLAKKFCPFPNVDLSGEVAL